jgi:ATP dependent DNA ligase domain
MLSRSPRGRPHNAPAAFIHPCQPTVATKPPTGPGWAHELKHDGYRLQIHVRDGRVRLFTMNGADWSKRYPLIIQDAARIKGSAILDAEAVWLDTNGWLTSRRCTVVSTMLALLPSRSICLWPTETICGAGDMSNEKRRCGNCYEVNAASSMSNTPRSTATSFLRPSASLGLRGSTQRSWIRLIDRGRRKAGSKSKIQEHPLQLALKTVRSDSYFPSLPVAVCPPQPF